MAVIGSKGQSECTCGHVGDVPSRNHDVVKLNNHAGDLGHGKCLVPTCTCLKFSWKRFLTKAEVI